MDPKLQNIFISYVTVPDGLQNRIMVRVRKAAKRKSMEKITAGGIVSIIFVVALVIIGRGIMAETALSGFGQYLSLIFTSGWFILTNWRDFGWTIIESAPITGLALCLGVTGLLIVAVRWTGRAWSGGGFSGINGKFAV
jgi:hypothetical protein